MTTNIIIHKMQSALGANPNGLTFGDCREQMKTDLLNTLTDIINKKSDHPRPYFILVHAKLDPAHPGGRVIKEKIIILDRPPDTRYLGTMLFWVDNKNADAEMVWNLPLDIPTPGILHTVPGNNHRVQGARSIMDSVKGLPVINRSLN